MLAAVGRVVLTRHANDPEVLLLTAHADEVCADVVAHAACDAVQSIDIGKWEDRHPGEQVALIKCCNWQKVCHSRNSFWKSSHYGYARKMLLYTVAVFIPYGAYTSYK